MSSYSSLLVVHALATTVWVGAVFLNTVNAVRSLANGGEGVAAFVHDSGWLGPRLFVPSSLLSLLTGIALVSMSWDYSQTWIQVTLVLFAISFAMGAGFNGPTIAKAARLIADGADRRTEAIAHVRKVTWSHGIEFILLSTVVGLMLLKPA